MIKEITKINWDKRIVKSPYFSPFHDFEWGTLVTLHLGGTFQTFEYEIDGKNWLIPIYLDDPWAPNNTCSTSSIGYGGPIPLHKISDPKKELEDISEMLREIRKKLMLKKINCQLYPNQEWNDILINKIYKTCIIDLDCNENTLFQKTLSGNVRTAIRKSIKENVTVKRLDPKNHNQIIEAHNLLATTQELIGSSYKTPYAFFADLISKNLAHAQIRTFSAFQNGRMLATATLIYNDIEGFHLFHGWDKNSSNTCANQALIWHMLCFTINKGIKKFNMGYSSTQNLLDAKLRWGGHLENVPGLTIT